MQGTVWIGTRVIASVGLAAAIASSAPAAQGLAHNEGAARCPFVFPDPEHRFEAETAPVLLSFPVFSVDDHLQIQGDHRSGFQLLVFSAHAFEQAGQLNTSATIGYIQTMRGPAVLFYPDEISAELDRIDENARMMLDAQTRREWIEIDGISVQAHVSEAEASKIATLMLPVNDGEFFHPVSIGIYTGTAGCEATMATTFDRVLAGASLTLDNPTYYGSERIQAAISDKREAR